jgi:hypothetical protein
MSTCAPGRALGLVACTPLNHAGVGIPDRVAERLFAARVRTVNHVLATDTSPADAYDHGDLPSLIEISQKSGTPGRRSPKVRGDAINSFWRSLGASKLHDVG